MRRPALIVNLYGGPGTGKSTTAALLFAKLKLADVNAELVHELAKDHTWEQRRRLLDEGQVKVFGDQLWALERAASQVDVIVTDGPLLNSLIYEREPTEAFVRFVLSVFRRQRTLNFLLTRDPAKPYIQSGRNQTYDEAIDMDDAAVRMLREHRVPHSKIQVEHGTTRTADVIYDIVRYTLEQGPAIAGADIAAAAQTSEIPSRDEWRLR